MPTDLPGPLPLLQLDDPVIVVDVESTGLDVRTDIPVEVAWANLATGERGEFVPWHNPLEVLRDAHPRALAVNGYRERILHHVGTLMDHDRSEAAKLWDQLTPKTGRPYLAGANAAGHDQWMLAKLWPALAWTTDFPWRYRILDVGNIGMVELGLDYIPGLSALVEQLGVNIPNPDHTSMGDVFTTAHVLAELLRRRDARLGIRRDGLGVRMCPEMFVPQGRPHGKGRAAVHCELTQHGKDVAHRFPDRATLQA